MKNKKLAVIVLGNRDSGKSNTWYEIFNRRVRSGMKKFSINHKTIPIYLKNSSFEETGTDISENCLVQNSSLEETGKDANQYFDENKLPNLVFCSVQYTPHGKETIDFFVKYGYYIYIQWLNPGFKDKKEYDDFLDFASICKHGIGEFHKVSGKEKAERSKTINQFVINWLITV